VKPRNLALAKFFAAAVLGVALYRFAPAVSYRVLALAFGVAACVELVVTDLTTPLSPRSRLIRAGGCCLLVVAFAPWRIIGAVFCLAVFGAAGISERARHEPTPRMLLWLAPLALSIGTWLLG
jgi:hypothetical protein